MEDLVYLYEAGTLTRLLLAAVLGALIGFERELAGKDPSLRTFMLICLGSCVFAVVSVEISHAKQMADPARTAAQVVSGVGFLGAGAIFKSPNGIEGLTTAALIWLAAAVGLAVGYGYQDIAALSTALAVIMMILLQWVHQILRRLRPEFYDHDDFLD